MHIHMAHLEELHSDHSTKPTETFTGTMYPEIMIRLKMTLTNILIMSKLVGPYTKFEWTNSFSIGLLLPLEMAWMNSWKDPA